MELVTMIIQIVLAVVLVLIAGIAIGFLILRTLRLTRVPEEFIITSIQTSVPKLCKSEPSGMKPKFEIYKDVSGNFRFRLKAPNREIIAVGEAYKSKDGCKRGYSPSKGTPQKRKWLISRSRLTNTRTFFRISSGR